MTLSNEFLAIPPDDPLAVTLFDLIGLQKVIMDRIVGGASNHLVDAAMDLVNKEITAGLEKYRLARGGDETCRVGLTYAVNGYPVVKGRPCLRVVARNDAKESK